ncbi:MAG: hypothetical protein KGO81_14765 [Bacteroidota bacterium]|nr:hypothetical protein [Bacteroidota bacterium]
MKQQTFTESFFYGNYFYGLCTVALSIEAAVQQYTALNPFWYYLFVFTGTVVYYTKAYITESTVETHNKRARWYIHNKTFVLYSQVILTLAMLLSLFFLLQHHVQQLFNINITEWILLLVFPAVAALYYGIATPLLFKYNLRNTGWMKPFVIGFVWAGAVTVYPIVFQHILAGQPHELNFFGVLLFIKNFMYISLLCILFDIKDYAADHNQQLKTFVVRVGLRKTIFLIIIPLSIVGLGTFLIYASLLQFPFARILINTIPFILLIMVAWSMQQRKSILYYLTIIDGLMLVKAACGITGMTLIK